MSKTAHNPGKGCCEACRPANLFRARECKSGLTCQGFDKTLCVPQSGFGELLRKTKNVVASPEVSTPVVAAGAVVGVTHVAGAIAAATGGVVVSETVAASEAVVASEAVTEGAVVASEGGGAAAESTVVPGAVEAAPGVEAEEQATQRQLTTLFQEAERRGEEVTAKQLRDLGYKIGDKAEWEHTLSWRRIARIMEKVTNEGRTGLTDFEPTSREVIKAVLLL